MCHPEKRCSLFAGVGVAIFVGVNTSQARSPGAAAAPYQHLHRFSTGGHSVCWRGSRPGFRRFADQRARPPRHSRGAGFRTHVFRFHRQSNGYIDYRGRGEVAGSRKGDRRRLTLERQNRQPGIILEVTISDTEVYLEGVEFGSEQKTDCVIILNFKAEVGCAPKSVTLHRNSFEIPKPVVPGYIKPEDYNKPDK